MPEGGKGKGREGESKGKEKRSEQIDKGREREGRGKDGGREVGSRAGLSIRYLKQSYASITARRGNRQQLLLIARRSNVRGHVIVELPHHCIHAGLHRFGCLED